MSISFKSICQSVSSFIAPTLKHQGVVCLTGSSGRVATQLTKTLTQAGIPICHMPRNVLNGPTPGVTDFLRRLGVNVTINLAALSAGPYSTMSQVNVEGALNLTDAVHKTKGFVIHASTTAATYSGINPKDHPYAYSKKKMEEKLLGRPNSTIARFDAIVGDTKASAVDIMMMASPMLPFTLHLAGRNAIFQPTPYEDIGTATENLVKRVLNNPNDIPKVINFAGEAITISDFTRLINDPKLELHIDPTDERVIKLMATINNGCASPEFLKLYQIAGEHLTILDNSYYRNELLGGKMQTPKELAALVKKNNTVYRSMRIGTEIWKQAPDKRQLVADTLRAIKACQIVSAA